MAASRFFYGMSLLGRGWRQLKREPSLWLWISIPWLLDLTVLFAGWTTGLGLLQGWIAAVIAKWAAGGWLFDLLYYPLVVIFGLGFVVVWLVAVVSIATVIAAPFNALLAEKSLQRLGVQTVQFAGVGAWVMHALKMIFISLCKAVIFGMAGVLLFAVSFLPGLNLVAAYFSMCLFSADVFDYSFEAQGLGFRQRLQRWGTLKAEIFGQGVTLSLTSLIPGLTVLALPVAVVGATTLIAQNAQQAQSDVNKR
ncbi:MAG: EI24 domain-containing protein [Bdellovibrionales bacterium]